MDTSSLQDGTGPGPEDRALLDAAETARARALGATACGAAVRTTSGAVFTAGSVEAPVHSLSVCAGQLAVYRAVAAGEPEIAALARVRPDSSAAPCGRCLQTLLEFAPRARVLWRSGGAARAVDLAELLPLPFERF